MNFRIADTFTDSLARLTGEEQKAVKTESLAISTKTVDAYKHRVQQKLGFVHRSDYARFGLEAGLLGV